MKTYRIIVACYRDEGDFFFCKVRCAEEQFDSEEYRKVVANEAVNHGYDGPMVFFEEGSTAFNSLSDLFEWDTASTFNIE